VEQWPKNFQVLMLLHLLVIGHKTFDKMLGHDLEVYQHYMLFLPLCSTISTT